jgi:hypothetical protein
MFSIHVPRVIAFRRLVWGRACQANESSANPRINFQDVAQVKRRGCALGMHRATDSKHVCHQ